MSPAAPQILRRASQCALIISHKFLDTFGGELVCNVKALPGKVQIQLIVGDRFQQFATRIDPFVPEILIRHWKARCGPFVQNCCRYSGKLSAQSKRTKQVVDSAYACG